MNEITRLPKQHASTQAAEGIPRLHWALAEFDRLTELGMFEEDDWIELIGGNWSQCKRRARATNS